MLQAIQQHFLQPLGLLALLGVIPVVIFYLVKPKPEEEVMPSMTFFTEAKKEGKIRSAFRKLKHNKLLLLHLVFVLIIALAAANLLIPGLETDGRAVVVLDNSASMKDNMQEARNFANTHLGQQNTVITADSNPEILAESVTAQKARKEIREVDETSQETNLRSAIQLASNYPGRLVLASDLRHTVSGQNVEPIIREIAGERTVKVMDLDHENSHGFTGLEIDGTTIRAEVTNFRPAKQNLLIQKPGENRRVKVDGGSTRTVEINLQSGKGKINLPTDEMATDNVLNVFMPEDRTVEVLHLGENNRYFKKAVELINFTEHSNSNTIQDADIYFVGKEFELDTEKIQRLDSEVKNGSGLIMERRKNLKDLAPAENFSEIHETTVSTPYSLTSSFKTEVYNYDIIGDPLGSPPEAFVVDGRRMLYNVKDKDFRQRISYPVFWKNAFKQIYPMKTGQELNLKTGETLEVREMEHKGKTLSGLVEIKYTGFYSGEETYASNLLSTAESAPYSSEVQDSEEVKANPDEDPGRKYISALLALIAAFELVYLESRGETRE